MCCYEYETLTQYQTTFSCVLSPHFRLLLLRFIPENPFETTFFSVIPYSRPKLFDFYSLSQAKLLENHTLHSICEGYAYIWEFPPPRSHVLGIYTRLLNFVRFELFLSYNLLFNFLGTKPQVTLKLKGHKFFFLVDKEGEFLQPTLFDKTVGVKRF